uniref:Uncharacterized protein n=1 Tax=Arundo donax TaxID=35708 RepID=A0A0A9BGJ8_ARUDO
MMCVVPVSGRARSALAYGAVTVDTALHGVRTPAQAVPSRVYAAIIYAYVP